MLSKLVRLNGVIIRCPVGRKNVKLQMEYKSAYREEKRGRSMVRGDRAGIDVEK